MAYEGPEYWYVIYKAVADFGDLMRDAAKAKQELQGMADAVKAETAAEVAGATKAAEARKADVTAIQQESVALSQLAASAKSTNVQLLYGGRNDMQQHLSDLASQLQYQTLLNRAQWLGFSTVQQAMAYRQQMYQQKLLDNKAEFAGYLTADQYLAYLQKNISQTSMQAIAIKARAAAIQTETAAFLAYDNAVQGTHVSIGQLGEGISGANALAAAVSGLPALVTTKAEFDDSMAMAQLAAYRAALTGLPRAESVDIISAATRLGGVPLTGRPPVAAQAVPALSGVAETGELDALGAALNDLAAREALAGAGAREFGADALLAAVDARSLADGVSRINAAYRMMAEETSGSENWDALRGITHDIRRGDLPNINKPGVTSTTAVFDDTAAGKEVERYKFLLDELPELEVIEAEFADETAESALRGFLGELMSAVQERYVFSASLDDTEALAALDEWMARIREAQAEEAKLAAGMGGARGGGGGGPPPAPPGPGAPPPEPPNPEDAAAWRALGDAEEAAGFDAQRAAADFLEAAAGANSAADAARYAYAAQAALRLAEVQAAAAAADNASKQAAAAGAVAAMVDPLVAVTGGWFGWNAQLRVWGGLMPGFLGTVAGWHIWLDAIIESLAILIPAIVTMVAGLGAFVLVANLAQDTLGRISDRLKATYTTATATGQAIYPVTNAFDSLAKVIRPQVWQLYGDALILAGGKLGVIGQLATATGAVLDRLAARFVAWTDTASKGLTTFFTVGGHDLAGLGQVLLNLGNALLNLIKVTQDTHVDQFFLDFLIGVTKLLDLITRLPTPLLAFVVGLHALYLWGGLATTIVLQLLNPLRALAVALGGISADTALGGLAKDSSAWQRLSAGLQDIGAGFAAIPGRIGLFSKATGEADVAASSAAASIAEEAAAMSGTGVAADAAAGGLGTLLGIPVVGWLAALAAALVGVSVYLGMMPDQTQKWITSLDSALAKTTALTIVSQTVGDLAAVTQQLAVAQSKGVGNATELANAQSDLNTKLSAELGHVGQISSLYGTSFVGALELLNTAGVKTSDLFTTQGKVWAADLIQVEGLVKGYAAMGQGLTELQQDVNVQLVSNADQLASMQKLNQAWDTFTQLVAAPVNSFLTLDTSLNTFTSDAGAAGAAMSGLGTNVLTAAGQTARSAPQISNAAITLQQQFQTVYSNVQSVFDAMRNSEAVTGSGGFASVVKDAVQVLIPLAGSNKAAAAEISSLAQEAGGPATTNLQQLAKWAGNSKDPLLNLYNAAEQATVGTSDLSLDAQRLTTALQQDLQPAMATAIFNAHGGQAVFSDFATSLAKSGPSSKVTVDAARSMATELLAVSGNSTNAKAEFVGFAEAMGLKAPEANKLWEQATQHITANLGSVRDSLAKTAGAVPELAKPGLWGQIEHNFMEGAKNGSLFEAGIYDAIPGVADALGKMNSAIGHFAVSSAKTIATFFTQTVPHAAESVASFFTGPFSTAVEGAWAHVWSALASPVVHAFDDVKKAIVNGFDGWWKTHGNEVKDIGRALWIGLSAVFTWGANLLTGDAKIMWSGLTSLFHGGSGLVSGIWRSFWGMLTSLAQGFWQLLEPAVRIGWAVVTGLFRIAVGSIETLVKAMWDGLVTLAKVFWAGLEAIIKIAWDTIVAIFSVALDLLTGHWSQAWSDIKSYGEQVWNAISGFFTAAWSAFRTDFGQTLNLIKSAWSGTWNDIKGAAEQVWGALKTGADNVVGALKTTWGTLEGIFKGPVSFLVNTVYDGGIARLWNDVMGAIGGPKLPVIKFQGGGLTEGGRLAGYGGGDSVPAWIKGGGPALLEPGEAVVDKDRTRKYSWLLKLMGVPGFQGGGIIGDIGSFFSGVGHDITNVLGDAFDIGKIAMALVTGNTTALGNALTKLIGNGGASGELADMITGIPKTIIHDLLSTALSAGKTAAASFGPSGPPPPGTGNAVAALKAAAARYGWATGAEWNALNTVEMDEAGYNIHAQNPGSGAYGLAQFINGPSEYAQYGGNSATAWGQAVGMVNYVKQRYGDPIAAAAHEAAFHWYRLGGPVRMATGGEVPVPYLGGFSARQAHNILVAAGLRPEANPGQKPNWWVSGSSPAGDAHVPPHFGVWINAHASTQPSVIKVPDLAGFSAGTAHNILAAEGLVPYAPAGQKATWQVTGTHPRKDTSTSHGAHVEILAAKPITPGPKGPTTPKGMDAAQAWSFYSSLLPGLYQSQDSAFWTLNSAKLPIGKGKATLGQWADWYADLLVMQSQQAKVSKAWGALAAHLADPGQMTSGQWSGLLSTLGTMKSWEHGTTPPQSAWSAEKGHPWPKGYKPGDVKPVNWAGWKYENALWNRANTTTASLSADVQNAFAAWKATYGQGAPPALYGTPGVLVTPEGGGSFPVDLSSLIPAGPASPVQVTGPSRSTTGMGFQAGGLVGDVASLFAFGVPDMPALAATALSSSFQRQLAGAGTQQRTLSDAAGERVGVKVGNLTINNPTPEKPSDSIARSSNRLAFLAGRGAV